MTFARESTTVDAVSRSRAATYLRFQTCVLTCLLSAPIGAQETAGVVPVQVIRDVARTSRVTATNNGSVFVVDPTRDNLLSFDGKRKEKRTPQQLFGGIDGSGPLFLGARADTAWVWHAGGGTVLKVDRHGGTAKLSLVVPESASPGAVFVPRMFTGDGDVIAEERGAGEAQLSFAAHGRLLIRTHPKEEFDTIAVLYDRHGPLQLEAPDGTMLVSRQPWAMQDLVAFNFESECTLLFLQEQDDESVGQGERMVATLKWLGCAAHQDIVRKVEFKRVPLKPAVVERFVSDVLDSRFGKAYKSAQIARRALMEALYQPEYLAIASSLVIGGDDTAWLQRGVDGESQEWAIVRPSGDVATVKLPRTFVLLSVSKEALWGIDVSKGARASVAMIPMARVLP